MESRALNTIGYTGQVNLAWYSKGRKIPFAKIHNVGGDALFQFIVKCLLGDFATASKTKPAKVMLLHTVQTADGVSIEPASQFIWLADTIIPSIVDTTSGCTIRYSFIIPQELVSGNFNSIGLYPANANDTMLEDYCAICQVVGQNNFNFNAATALAVDWDLTFANRTTTI